MSASTNSHKTWNNFDILQNKSKYLKGQLGSPVAVSDEKMWRFCLFLPLPPGGPPLPSIGAPPKISVKQLHWW